MCLIVNNPARMFIIRYISPRRDQPIGDGSCLENSRGVKALASSTLAPSAIQHQNMTLWLRGLSNGLQNRLRRFDSDKGLQCVTLDTDTTTNRKDERNNE